jgi:hypothetical protein
LIRLRPEATAKTGLVSINTNLGLGRRSLSRYMPEAEEEEAPEADRIQRNNESKEG